MRHNECPFALDKKGACDSVGIRVHKGRVWISVVGLLLSLLSAMPFLLPGELFSASSPLRALLLWTLFVTPPLALVANMIVVIYGLVTCGRSIVLGAIGLVISLITCALWAKGLLLLILIWQNGPICP